MVNMMSQKSQKQVREFIGLVNYYRDMWAKQSHLLHFLTALTSNKVNFKLTYVEHKAFGEIRRIVACDILLIKLDINKCFDVHTDSSDSQIGALISQDGKPITFYNHKLTGPKTRLKLTEKKFLSIVKILNEFCLVLLGK